MNVGRIRVPVPAEMGGEDRLVGSLTFRHAAYLAIAAGGLAVMLLGHVSAARLRLGAVLAVVGVAGAILRPHGEPLDRLAFTAVAYLSRRRETRSDDRAGVPTDDPRVTVEAKPAPGAPPESPDVTEHRSRMDPVLARRVLVAVALCGVAAIAATRLMERPTDPTPNPRVVVVQVPASPPDPWGEVDRDFDEWLSSFG